MEKAKILVWDLPLRSFHWLLAISFTGAFLTAESERLRDVHVVLGYTVLGLLAFRLLWAVVGSRYARLSSFAFGPKAVIAYLKSLPTRCPIHYVGHNPAGSWAIYAVVILGFATGITGYAVYNDLGAHGLESLHEGIANVMLAVIVGHVIGVLVSSVAHRENLARAMITGYKIGKSSEAIVKSHWIVAAGLIFAVALLWIPAFDISGTLINSPTMSSVFKQRHASSKHRAADADEERSPNAHPHRRR